MESAVMAKSRPRTSRRGNSAGAGEVRPDARSATGSGAGRNAVTDAVYRHIVSGMRNGVLAITRDASLALINDEAYRIFGVAPQPDDVGQPIASVLRDHPDVVRVLAGAFDLHHLPNRVEMRLKPSNKVIGYTRAFVRSDDGDEICWGGFVKI